MPKKFVSVITFTVFLFIGMSLLSPTLSFAATLKFDSQGTFIIDGKRFFPFYANRLPTPPEHSAIWKNATWEYAKSYYHVNLIQSLNNDNYNTFAEKYDIYLTSTYGDARIYYDDFKTSEPDDGWWNDDQVKARIKELNNKSRVIYPYISEENCCDIPDDGYQWYLDNIDKPRHANRPKIREYTDAYRGRYDQVKNFLNTYKINIFTSHWGDHIKNMEVMLRLRGDVPSLKAVMPYISGWEDYCPESKPKGLGCVFDTAKMKSDIINLIVMGANGLQFWDFPQQERTFSGSYGETMSEMGALVEKITPGLVAPKRTYKDRYMRSKGEDGLYYVVVSSGNGLLVSGLPANTKFQQLYPTVKTVSTNSNGRLRVNPSQAVYREKVVSSPTPTITPTLLLDISSDTYSTPVSFSPTITAQVAGTATGDIRYRIDCDYNDTNTWDKDFTTTNDIVSRVCNYIDQGIKTVKVRVDRNGVYTTSTLNITVFFNGDANYDGVVDNVDLDLYKEDYKILVSYKSPVGDFNRDGITDILDYPIWLNTYSGSELTPTLIPTTTPTPFPTSTTPIPTEPPTKTVTAVYPQEDSFVNSKYPNHNYGSNSALKIDGSPTKIAYIKFDLSEFGGNTITNAKLRIYVTDSSGATQNIKLTSNGWTENTITFNNAPTSGALVTSFNGGNKGSWVEINLTNMVNSYAGQIFSLAIDSGGTNGLNFNSKNASLNKPRLRVEH